MLAVLASRGREGAAKGMEMTFSMLRAAAADEAVLPGMGMLAERDILEVIVNFV